MKGMALAKEAYQIDSAFSKHHTIIAAWNVFLVAHAPKWSRQASNQIRSDAGLKAKL